MNIMVYSKNISADAAAMEIARSHAKAFDGSIYVVSVIQNQAGAPEEVVEDTRKRLEAMAADTVTKYGIKCRAEVVTTSLPLGEGVVQYAEKHEINEIIMPLKKRSKLGKLLFGSNSQHIILEAPCQVTTIKG